MGGRGKGFFLNCWKHYLNNLNSNPDPTQRTLPRKNPIFSFFEKLVRLHENSCNKIFPDFHFLSQIMTDWCGLACCAEDPPLCSHRGSTTVGTPGNTYSVSNKPSYKQGNPSTEIVAKLAPPQLTRIPSLTSSWQLLVSQHTSLFVVLPGESVPQTPLTYYLPASLIHHKLKPKTNYIIVTTWYCFCPSTS